MRAPSASSRSADPDRPVAERLPCLATVQPAPAAISAAVVETLNVRRPPPVPAVSSRSSRLDRHRVASARIVARQAGELVDGLALDPQRDQEARDLDLGGLAGHDLGEHRRASASRLRSWPPASGVDRGGQHARGHRVALQEVRQQLPAVVGQHRLRVELDALGGQRAVADGHHDVVAGRAALQHGGQLGRRRSASGSGRPRAVAAARGRSCGRRAGSRWSCRAPAHGVMTLPPHAWTSAWWPRQTPSVGIPACGKRRTASSEIPASSGCTGRARRSRGHSRAASSSSTVARSLRTTSIVGAAELAEVLDEVVGEAVVVVEDEDPHRLTATPAGRRRARSPASPRGTWRPTPELVVGLGVGDGAAARLDVSDAVLDHDGADVDAGVELAGVARLADRAAVAAALDRLELVDDLHRADLGRARQRARGQHRAQRVERAHARAQRARTRSRRCASRGCSSRRP